MAKNYRIEVKVKKDIKDAIERKAASYGSITRFIEELAKKDIIIVDKRLSNLLKGDKI